MNVRNRWMRWLMVVAALAIITGVAAVAAPSVAQAAANLVGPWGPGMRGATTDRDERLADALGITVEELDAAQAAARDAALDEAVADGSLTQEEADLMKARWAFQSFVADQMKDAYDKAVAAAVEEGIVTQEQADTFTQEGGFGGHGFMGHEFMGRGFTGHGFMGRGMMYWDDSDEATPRWMPGGDPGDMPGGMYMRPRGRMH